MVFKFSYYFSDLGVLYFTSAWPLRVDVWRREGLSLTQLVKKKNAVLRGGEGMESWPL